MDPLSHLAVAAAFVGRDRRALVGSLAPDLPWYALYPAWLVARGGFGAALRSGEWPLPPRWLQGTHHAAHSLLLLGLAWGIARRLGRADGQFARAWLLHILLDMPTHARQRMGVRVLWPLLDWAMDGISWADLAAQGLAALARLAKGAYAPGSALGGVITKSSNSPAMRP